MVQKTGARKRSEATQPAGPREVALVRARDILGELVDRALYDGEPTVITRRGRAAAILVPVPRRAEAA